MQERRVTESAVLRRVKDQCWRLGLVHIRQSFRPGVSAGWPDSLIIGPNGGTMFAELKRPGKPLAPLQAERARQIQAMGHHYAKIDSLEEASATLLRFAAWCHGLLK